MQGHLRTYLDEAMERFRQDQQERAYQAIYPSQRIKLARAQETHTPDVEMESVRSRLSRSDIFDPDYSGQEERRRAMIAHTETLQNGGGIPHRIRVSAMAELKELVAKIETKIGPEAGSAKSSRRSCAIRHQMKKSVWCSAI